MSEVTIAGVAGIGGRSLGIAFPECILTAAFSPMFQSAASESQVGVEVGRAGCFW